MVSQMIFDVRHRQYAQKKEVFMTNLERLRRERGLTQKVLMGKTNVRQEHISDFERGKRNLRNASINTICLLSDALKVKLWEIFDDERLAGFIRECGKHPERQHDIWYIGSRISEIRREEKLSQEDLAGMLDVSQQRVSRWEICGGSRLRIDTLCYLSVQLDCHLCDLIDEKFLRKLLRSVLKEKEDEK